MIAFTVTCLVLALIFFIFTKDLNSSIRLLITFSIVMLPVVLLISLMLTGDKAPKNSPIIYQGPKMVEHYKQEKEYLNLVREGKQLESKGRYAEAIQRFNKALKINRGALPSYYVLMDLAKAQYFLKDMNGCKMSLQEFIKLAEIETNPEVASNNEIFIIIDNTEARLAKIKADIVEAKHLLAECK